MNDFSRLIVRWASGVLLLLLLAGCATNKIDWSTRVGSYTYDQAVNEMGPPDKYAKLEDNTMVADWLLSRSRYQTSSGPGSYQYGTGPVYPSYSTVWTTDYFIRLTFGPDRKLQSWKKYTR